MRRLSWTGHARGCRAFTLIEILTVVVVLGIISAVVVPQIGSRDDLKAAAGARILMSDLMYAQNLAITTQKAQYIRFDTTRQAYGLYNAVPLTTPITDPVTRGAYVKQLGPGGGRGLSDCALGSVSFDGRSTLMFDEMGSPYACDSDGGNPKALVSGQVVVRSGKLSLSVSVEPYTGNLSVAEASKG